ncbi:MAG TPA: hypothetical protein VMZ50_06280 [Phycisphaerae bacterium]|nr:hypothetical protein [Phycisphaerae bacterium]
MSQRIHCVVLASVLLCGVLLPCGVVLGAGAAKGIAETRPQPTASGAERYYQWLMGALDGIEKQMPEISRSADAAAELFVKDEKTGIGAVGDRGFVGEALGRAGGIIRINYPHQLKDAGWKGAVLFGLRAEALAADLAMAAKKKEHGCVTIAMGQKSLAPALKKAGMPFDVFIANGAADHDGLLSDAGGRWVIPTVPAANIAAMWTWTGEFVAACTRRGKMPPMYLAYSCPGGRAWSNKYGSRKFHEAAPNAVPAGQLGREYLRELRADLRTVHDKEMADIRKVAGLAVETRKAGKGVYAFTHGHAILQRLAGPGNPGYFTQINRSWVDLRKDIQLRRGDLVYCVGFDQLFGGSWFRDFDKRAREAGAQLAWSISACRKGHTDSLPPDEPLIDQHWDFGDSAVVVPGYEIKILPVSGVIAEAALWMVSAEIHTMVSGEPASKEPVPAPAGVVRDKD